MNFGEALSYMKAGKAVYRIGWNGKGMFVYCVQSNSYPAQTDVAKTYFDNQPVPYKKYLAMKTVDEDVVPWLASQTDLLADDWELKEL